MRPRTPESSRALSAPRLLPLALQLLGPALLLAVLAGVALVRDWRWARVEATSRAGELAASTADRAVEVLRGAVSPEGSPAVGGAHRGDGFLVDGTNGLISPSFLPWPPRPSPMAGPSEASASGDWDTARQAMAAGKWDAAAEAYERLLKGENGAAMETSSAEWRWRANAWYELALAREQSGRKNGLATYFQRALEVAEAGARAGDQTTTEAGVPVGHLAALRILELAGGRVAELPEAWRREPGRVVVVLESMASPFSASCQDRLRPLLGEWLAEGGAGGPTPTGLEDRWRRSERGRAHHAAAARTLGKTAPWPTTFWIEEGASNGLVVAAAAVGSANGTGNTSAGPGQWYGVLSEAELRSALRSAVRGLDARGDFRVRLSVGGRVLSVTAGEGEPGRATGTARPAAEPDLGSASRGLGKDGSLIVGVALADDGAFFAGQRRRSLIFGGLLGAAVVAAGISVRATHRALVQQHALNVQKSNFVSSVSHELRAPLGSIRLLAEGLERGSVADEERRREYYRLIGQETRRLGGLVENVLDFSRIEQGRKEYEFEPVDLSALVRGTVAVLEPLARVAGVKIEIEAAGTWEIVADGRALQQALVNLLDNALKHSPEGSTIRVGLAAEATPRGEGDASGGGDRAKGVRLWVADQGCGIPAADHERIFEPFIRRGSELRRDTQGVGIGLSIVRHIAAAHGGTVRVRSEPGAGAEFIVELPCDS